MPYLLPKVNFANTFLKINQQVAVLSSERKKSNENFLLMQERMNSAEIEKRKAIMQAEVQLSEFLRVQQMTSGANISPVSRQSMGTDVTRSMENLFQNYRSFFMISSCTHANKSYVVLFKKMYLGIQYCLHAPTKKANNLTFNHNRTNHYDKI
jgi:hypothetical protein